MTSVGNSGSRISLEHCISSRWLLGWHNSARFPTWKITPRFWACSKPCTRGFDMAHFGLPERTLAIVRSILADFPQVEKAILYGSRAKGSYQRGSDIDLTLLGAELDSNTLAAITGRLEESSIPYQVDLSLKAQIDNPGLLAHIERVGVAFYVR